MALPKRDARTQPPAVCTALHRNRQTESSRRRIETGCCVPSRRLLVGGLRHARRPKYKEPCSPRHSSWQAALAEWDRAKSMRSLLIRNPCACHVLCVSCGPGQSQGATRPPAIDELNHSYGVRICRTLDSEFGRLEGLMFVIRSQDQQRNHIPCARLALRETLAQKSIFLSKLGCPGFTTCGKMEDGLCSASRLTDAA